MTASVSVVELHTTGLDEVRASSLTISSLSQCAKRSSAWLKQLYRCSSISTGDPRRRYSVRVGRGLEVFEDGELMIHAFVDVGHPDTMGSDFYWKMDPISVAVESIEVEKAIEETIAAVEEKTAEGLEVFAEKAPTPMG